MPVEVAVLVPIKAFSQAKARLAEVLDQKARANLSRRMAERVIAAAGDLPVSIACDDDEVQRWARAIGVDVIWTPDRGLNGAVTFGVGALQARGVRRVIVSHADLPRANDLSQAAHGDGVTAIPDRHDDGTNVLAVPSDAGFTFAYGPGSFLRHCDAAARLGRRLTVLRPPDLTWDVDVPADLEEE
jgi:2-phospho-L-lactate guanylyltransferase